jgi:uncharacterized protein (DUF2461 family)
MAGNNEKAWFEANHDVYEREVREPMRLLVETLDAKRSPPSPPRWRGSRAHRDSGGDSTA